MNVKYGGNGLTTPTLYNVEIPDWTKGFRYVRRQAMRPASVGQTGVNYPVIYVYYSIE